MVLQQYCITFKQILQRKNILLKNANALCFSHNKATAVLLVSDAFQMIFYYY